MHGRSGMTIAIVNRPSHPYNAGTMAWSEGGSSRPFGVLGLRILL